MLGGSLSDTPGPDGAAAALHATTHRTRGHGAVQPGPPVQGQQGYRRVGKRARDETLRTYMGDNVATATTVMILSPTEPVSKQPQKTHTSSLLMALYCNGC